MASGLDEQLDLGVGSLLDKGGYSHDVSYVRGRVIAYIYIYKYTTTNIVP